MTHHVAILRAARSLIDTPDKWTQYHFARDDDDRVADHNDPTACRFCVVGAIMRALGARTPTDKRVGEMLQLLTRHHIGTLPSGLANFNDSPATTHAHVLALLDRAIAVEAVV